jgi:hypothetical protein
MGFPRSGPPVLGVVSHVANELRVLLASFAATDPALASSQYPYFVRGVHDDRFQMAAIADVVLLYGWREVTAIYVDDDYGRGGVVALADVRQAMRARVSYKAAFLPGADRAMLADVRAHPPAIEVEHTASPQHDCLNMLPMSARASVQSYGAGHQVHHAAVGRALGVGRCAFGVTFDKFLDEAGGNVTFSANPNNSALGLNACLTRASSCSGRSCSPTSLVSRAVCSSSSKPMGMALEGGGGSGVPRRKRRVEARKSSSGRSTG